MSTAAVCRLAVWPIRGSEVRPMHRWFPAPALLAVALWAVAGGAMAAGAAGRTVATWSDRAAGATLLVHAGTLLGLGRGRTRRDARRRPDWVQVQEAKHRRKGVWFALWGLGVLGLGWLGRGAWFGAPVNLGFQPGVFLAEWATIAAHRRLGRSGAGGELN